MSVSIEGLCFAHPKKPKIFDNFSLDLRPGSVTALLGPSGSGKSTLLRLVAGLLRPDAGTIRRPPTALGRAPTGVVFQDPRLLPWMSVWDNARFALTAAGVPASEHHARIAPLLDAVGLDGAASPRTLSGGMAQRAALVRTLALRPELLLLDEPFAAVDPLLREGLQALIAPLLLGVTTLLVTHDIGEAVLLADRVIVLEQHSEGRVEIRADREVDAARPRGASFRNTTMYQSEVEALRGVVFTPLGPKGSAA